MKVFAVVPAYNAEKTLEAAVARIPHNSVDQIVIVDDGSKDNTKVVMERLKAREPKLFTLLYHNPNRGYGGAQKSLYRESIRQGADLMIMVHADGQYPPEKIPEIVELYKQGSDVVFCYRTKMLQGGMPITKFIGNRLLTFIENIVFGMWLHEYHTGYRAYSAKFLNSVNYEAVSEYYDFDSEIVPQCKLAGFKIKEISIPTRYGDERSYLKLFKYGKNIIGIMWKYILFRIGIKNEANKHFAPKFKPYEI